MHDDAVNTIQKLICVSRYLFCGTFYVLLRFKYLCSAIHVVTGLSSFNDLEMKFFYSNIHFWFYLNFVMFYRLLLSGTLWTSENLRTSTGRIQCHSSPKSS